MEPVSEVLRIEVSAVTTARRWLISSQSGWVALWDSVPVAERGGRTLPVIDFSRDVVVVVSGGVGRSGAPALTFDGYVIHGDTTNVFVRRADPAEGCSIAEDVTALLIAGRVPRKPGPVRIIQRRVTKCG